MTARQKSRTYPIDCGCLYRYGGGIEAPCTQCAALHTHNEPMGYLAWHMWADVMRLTHKQIKCGICGRYAIWIPKTKRAREAAQ